MQLTTACTDKSNLRHGMTCCCLLVNEQLKEIVKPGDVGPSDKYPHIPCTSGIHGSISMSNNVTRVCWQPNGASDW